ncbi:GNAT family N-acetyltransferase [Halomonas denitrificans]|nr:GNAT family N-acetyltransferase [Halomonas denitrificans]
MAATPLGAEHLADIDRLHSDPQVMAFLSADGRPLPESVSRSSIDDAVAHWQQHGFGFWAFHDRQSGRFLGRGGLKTYVLDGLDGKAHTGLAYAIRSSEWGRGFATEMASGILSLAFGPLAQATVGSWTLPSNRASQRVMEKLGFRYRRDFDFAGLTHRYYDLDRDHFRAVK